MKVIRAATVMLPVDHLAAADPQDPDEAQRREDLEERIEEAAQARHRDALVVDVVRRGLELARLYAFGAESLHDPDPREALLDDMRHTGEAFLQTDRDRMQQRRKLDRGNEHERQGGQRDSGQLGVEHEQHDRDTPDHDEVRAGNRDEDEQHLHLLRVGARRAP